MRNTKEIKDFDIREINRRKSARPNNAAGQLHKFTDFDSETEGAESYKGSHKMMNNFGGNMRYVSYDNDGFDFATGMRLSGE